MMLNELQPSIGDRLEARGNHSVFSKARLQPGVSLAEAQVAADAVATQLTEDRIEDWDLDATFVLVPTDSVLLYRGSPLASTGRSRTNAGWRSAPPPGPSALATR